MNWRFGVKRFNRGRHRLEQRGDLHRLPACFFKKMLPTVTV